MKNQSCSHYPDCSGCHFLELAYLQQLSIKQKFIEDLFDGSVPVKKIIPAASPFYYRHKVQLPFGLQKKNNRTKAVLGLHSKNYTQIINMNECRIQDKTLTSIVSVVRTWAQELKIPTYNYKNRTGTLRYLLLRKGAHTNEVLVGIITNTEARMKESYTKGLLDRLMDLEDFYSNKASLAGIVQNINTKDTNMVLGNKDYLLYGNDFVRDRVGDYTFKTQLSTFVQINPYQVENLYNTVLDSIQEGEKVIDGFSGMGTISMWIHKKASQVLAIESNPKSVKSAIESIKEYDLKNIEVVHGDVGAKLKKVNQNYDTLVVDPPRIGIDKNTIPVINSLSIPRIIYVSCNPFTLRENTHYLNSYQLQSIQPVDMFPHTDQVECVAIFQKK